MDIHDLTRRLKEKNDSKIVLVVADGIGGLRFGALNRDRAIDPIDRGVIGHRWIRGPAWMAGFPS